MSRTHRFLSALLLSASALAVAPRQAHAMPSFARKENLGCPVCHTAFPELNETGRAYKDNSYRFPGAKSGKAKTTAKDLGGGVKVDPIPGLAVVIKGALAAINPDMNNTEQVTGMPFGMAHIMGAGVSGDNWSYTLEVTGMVDEDFAVDAGGFVEYDFSRQLGVFGGRSSLFGRDIYNTLSEGRFLDHQEHAVTDYEGSLGAGLNEESAQLGIRGRVGPASYMVLTSPGPGSTMIGDMMGGGGSMADLRMDYLGRLAFDVTPKVEMGGFVYSGNTTADSTVRVALDAGILSGAGNYKVVAMYDTLDQAVAAEASWDLPEQLGSTWLVPLARVDFTAADETSVAPAVGFGVQRSGGRLQAEVSYELGAGSPPPPSVQLDYIAAF